MRSTINSYFRLTLFFLILAVILLFSVSALVPANAQTPFGIGCASQPPIESSPILRAVPIDSHETATPFVGVRNMAEQGTNGSSQPFIEIHAELFGLPLAQDDVARQYTKANVLLQQGNELHFDVMIPDEGEYTLTFDVAVLVHIRCPRRPDASG